MVSIKRRAIEALKRYQARRTLRFESGTPLDIHAGDYVLIGFDLALQPVDGYRRVRQLNAELPDY